MEEQKDCYIYRKFTGKSKKVVMATAILILVTDHEAVVSIMTPFVYYTFYTPFALELVFS